MMRNIVCYILSVLIPVFLCEACAGPDEREAEQRLIDSLNENAYSFRYKDIDSTEAYAFRGETKAIAAGYGDQRVEAMCNRAFAKFMRMDYDCARALYDSIYDMSKNELLLLIADVGNMKICQRISANKDFYDYRNSALKRMERIRAEGEDMTAHQEKLWNYARSEFRLVSCTYYYYLRQEEQAIEEMDSLRACPEIMDEDPAQFAYYLYIIGSGGVTAKSDEDDENLYETEERTLVRALAQSLQHGLTFFEACALQALAGNLIATDSIKPSRMTFVKEMLGADSQSADELATYMLGRSISLFEKYGYILHTSGAYLTLADYYSSKGRYDKALEAASTALEYINEHHKSYALRKKHPKDENGKTEKDNERLHVFQENPDSISTEMKWINDDGTSTIPEWMASVREHLSMIYSGLGMKRESDFNRNVYLDILDATRQDMRIQQRYDTLASEEKMTNAMLFFIAALTIIILLAAFWLSKKLKAKSRLQAHELSRITEICRKMAEQFPKDAEDTDDVERCIHDIADEDVKRLFPHINEEWEDLDNRINKYERELLRALHIFREWMVRTSKTFLALTNEGRMLESERHLHERRIRENKRANIDKCTCLSIVNGISPFLDRAIREVRKLQETGFNELSMERLIYVSELTDKINAHNEVLSHWIKIRQGVVSLNVENFELSPLFDTLSKGRKAFEGKGLTLRVDTTDAIVKADKALTLFMMSTLLENARKFTLQGKVTLSAEKHEEYVEISVKDTGRGLSEEDIKRILDEKVYDSSRIGDVQSDDDLRRNKGYGFGLMNCRGIIEKYRKSNTLFSVCKFGIESEKGMGSRFFFRLPHGVLRTFSVLILFGLALTSLLTSCAHDENVSTAENQLTKNDSVVWKSDDPLLITASAYADKAYYANVDGFYQDAILFADTSITYLNRYYLENAEDSSKLMTLYGKHDMPEIDLWNEDFNTDYHVILDIRNETAIAALAINDWGLYRYNNEIYTRLYKLMAQDSKLSDYCDTIHQANINKQTVIILTIILLILGLLAYYLMYYRHILIAVFNMSQLILFNKKMFSADKEKRLGILAQGISDVRLSDGVALAIIVNDGKDTDISFSASCPEQELMGEMLRHTISTNKAMVRGEGRYRTYPLVIDKDGERITVGAAGIVFHNTSISENEELTLKLMMQFVAINVYYTETLTDAQQMDIELLRDEKRRAENEENNIHVQNMVLDNCLSTIKHETMYYPNRIKQIVDRILSDCGTPETESANTGRVDAPENFTEQIDTMSELITYYKEIFTLLSTNASRQLEKVTFRRKEIAAKDIAAYAEKSLKRQNKKLHVPVKLTLTNTQTKQNVVGDRIMIEYLIDNIISALLECKETGDLTFDFENSGGFTKFALTDKRQAWDEDKISNMFYADNLRYDFRTDSLHGAQFLICKQIIREHDEHGGKRGCRIYAEKNTTDGKGIRIVFTLPSKD